MYYLLIAGDALMILTVILKFSHLPPRIPLFYSMPWGEDQLADTWMIVLLPILEHMFFFLNIFISRRFFLQDEFVKKIFHYLNLALIITVTFIFVRIIFLIA